MTKCIVTGGAGFIGSNLVDELINLDYEVIVIDDESSESHENFYYNDKAVYYKLNICDEKTKDLYNGVDYVFHMAAESRIPKSIANPVETIITNVVGTSKVLQFSREAKVKRVMYSSTSSGYGLKNEIPNIESQPDDCLNPYSVSKVAGEKICKMYSDLFELPTIVFRYFNVYGERQPIKGQYAPVTGVFIRQKNAGEPLTIVGDGEARRDYVYVKDIVKANIMASTAEISPEHYGTVFNVGTGVNYSVNEIADMISDNQVNVPPRQGEAKESLADTTKIFELIGWTPEVELKNWIGLNK
jgi:UDP-glucose 4-epimerase